MTVGRTHLFVGPSLPPDGIPDMLPDAIVHGPIVHGDVLRLAPKAGDTLAIVDGVFMQSAAVRHKELLHVMDEGVEVWGAASMGALRAAELSAFGMRGIGLVAKLYELGVLDRDDEVAVVHAPAERQYEPLTASLVSLRIAARRARRRGIIDAEVEAQLVAAANSLPFAERRHGTVTARAVSNGADAAQCDAFVASARDPAQDVKRQDAELLLRTLQERCKRPAAPARRRVCPRTIHLAHWLHRFTGSHHDGVWVSEELLLAFHQLFAAGYPEFHRRLALRTIAGTPNLDGQALESSALAAAQARGLLSASTPQLSAPLRAWLTPDELEGPPHEAALAALVRSFRQPPGVAPVSPALDALRDTATMDVAAEHVAGAVRLNLSLAAHDRAYVPRRISKERARDWFSQRWGLAEAPGRFDVAIFDRGFVSNAHFMRHAREFLPYAILRGVPPNVPAMPVGV